MTPRLPNPVRLVVLWIGLLLVRLELLDPERARKTTDLASPGIILGFARTSKSAVDVAMVGIAIGPLAIAGVGFATPFWWVAFALGGGLAGGAISLTSQRYGADAHDEIGQVIRTTVAITLAVTLPIAAVFRLFPGELIALLSDNEQAIALGSAYLEVLALGVPFVGLNLIGSYVLVGVDDAWTPMVVRVSGALANVLFNAVLIFGLGLGVIGAATGTVLANLLVTAAFAIGLTTGRLPLLGPFPIRVDPVGRYADPAIARHLVEISLPIIGAHLVWTVAEFPLLAIVDMYGGTVVAAFVIARRVWSLINTPGWGFWQASSSLVGQELGAGEERSAEAYGREIIRFTFVVYLLSAVIVFIFAEPISLAFLGDRADPSFPVTVALIYAACVSAVLFSVSTAASAPLTASGDTRWPMYSQALAMFGFSIPLAYLGATTPIGIVALYLAFVAETGVPAVINYYRFSTGKWMAISRTYRPVPAVNKL